MSLDKALQPRTKVRVELIITTPRDSTEYVVEVPDDLYTSLTLEKAIQIIESLNSESV